MGTRECCSSREHEIMTPIRIRLRNRRTSRKRRASASRVEALDRHWVLRKAGRITLLQSVALNKHEWVAHGFSTRTGGASSLPASATSRTNPAGILNLGFSDWDVRAKVEENRRLFTTAMGVGDMKMVPLRQFHSDVIHVIDSAPADSLRGDALITRTPGLLLAVQTPDCIPILLADPLNRRAAAPPTTCAGVSAWARRSGKARRCGNSLRLAGNGQADCRENSGAHANAFRFAAGGNYRGAGAWNREALLRSGPGRSERIREPV